MYGNFILDPGRRTLARLDFQEKFRIYLSHQQNIIKVLKFVEKRKKNWQDQESQ